MAYRNLLKEGLEERVKRFVDDIEGDIPEFEGIEKEHLVYNITEGAIGRLYTVLDTFIKEATFDFANGIRWVNKRNEEGK